MSAQDKITIVAASDNHYAILVAAMLKSLEVNHKTAEKLDVYVIDDGISPKNKAKIQASVNPDITTLNWKKPLDVIPTDIKLPVDQSAFPLTAYMRLFAPYAVPKEVKKIIYLDVDMIVTADISKLWHTDIGDYLFGAVQDLGEVVSCAWGGIPNYKELGIPAETKYFNSGLLVINPVKWRAMEVPSNVIRCMNENKKHVNYADQYGLNVFLYNKWFELDKRWNCFAAKKMDDYFIIHFLDVKPIFKSYHSVEEYKTEFYKYLRLTPWKNHTPVSDFRRSSRKAYNKLKKMALNLFKA